MTLATTELGKYICTLIGEEPPQVLVDVKGTTLSGMQGNPRVIIGHDFAVVALLRHPVFESGERLSISWIISGGVTPYPGLKYGASE